jgi:lysophospholipase L1-like esterase
MPTARPRVFRAAALVIAVAGALTCAEFALRVALGDRFAAGPPPRRVERVLGRYDAERGWSLTPGGAARVQSPGCAYDVALNSCGYRDRERPPRAAGVRRIVFLGDSYGFGWGVAQDECVSALLERDPRVGAEVVNLCVPGYGTDQELWTFERDGERLAPDLVLLEFCANDVAGNETTRSHRMYKPQFFESGDGNWTVLDRPVATFAPVAAPPPSWDETSLSWSALWQVLSRRTPLLAPETVSPSAPAAGGREPFGPHGATWHAFDLLAARCRACRVPLVVFGVPCAYASGSSLPPDDGSQDRDLAKLASVHGFKVVSVERAFREAQSAGRNVIIPDDGHWNADGHRVAADALAPELAALLPPR